MDYKSNTNLQTLKFAIKQCLVFALVCFFIVIFGGMLEICVLKIKPFYVVSNSMEPTLKVGEVVFVKETNEYNVGDILSFISKEHGGIVVTHRCISVEVTNGIKHYVCKGDNSSVAFNTQNVGETDVLGKVVYVSTFLGDVVNFVQTNKFLIILTVSLFVISSFVFNKDTHFQRTIYT